LYHQHFHPQDFPQNILHTLCQKSFIKTTLHNTNQSSHLSSGFLEDSSGSFSLFLIFSSSTFSWYSDLSR
jgi:hypothetical protein